MCGDLKPGESAAQLVVHFLSGTTSARVVLNTRLEHIVEWRLTDYSIVNPNGGALTPNMWKFEIVGIPEFETSNTGVPGFAITMNSATATWAHYDNPRVISKFNSGYVNTINCQLRTYAGAAAAFDEATFHFTIVTKDAKFRPQQYMLDDRQTPNFPSMQYDTRATI